MYTTNVKSGHLVVFGRQEGKVILRKPFGQQSNGVVLRKPQQGGITILRSAITQGKIYQLCIVLSIILSVIIPVKAELQGIFGRGNQEISRIDGSSSSDWMSLNNNNNNNMRENLGWINNNNINRENIGWINNRESIGWLNSNRYEIMAFENTLIENLKMCHVDYYALQEQQFCSFVRLTAINELHKCENEYFSFGQKFYCENLQFYFHSMSNRMAEREGRFFPTWKQQTPFSSNIFGNYQMSHQNIFGNYPMSHRFQEFPDLENQQIYGRNNKHFADMMMMNRNDSRSSGLPRIEQIDFSSRSRYPSIFGNHQKYQNERSQFGSSSPVVLPTTNQEKSME